MPRNTACFTNGSWTAVVPPSHRFAQETSQQKNVATARLFYCADCPDWERYTTIALHVSGGNSIRAQSAFPMKLLALYSDLSFEKRTNTSRRIDSDCQAATTYARRMTPHPVKNTNTYHLIIKALAERGKDTRDTWTLKELGNFIADIVAGPEYTEKHHQEGLQVMILRIPAVELLQPLVPSNLWNVYTSHTNPVSLAHAAAVWEERDHHAI